MITMNKLLIIFTKVMKIWNFKINKDEAYSAIDRAFSKYDLDKSDTLEIKDLLLELWEVYKEKK
jgi:hypothetical protein